MSSHISPVDCAPVSPLVSLSSQLSSIGSQLQNIPSFGQQSKHGSVVPSSAAAPLLSARPPPSSLLASSSHPQHHHTLRPAIRADGTSLSHGGGGAFVSQFHDGVQLDGGNEALVAQLRRMELSKQAAHADELERIYRQHAHPHPLPHQSPHAQHSPHWAAEFNAAQPHLFAQQQQQQQMHRMHQQIVQHTPQWAAEFEAIKHQQQHQHQHQHHQHHTPLQQPPSMHPVMAQHSRPMLPLSSYSAPYTALHRPLLHMPPAASLFAQPAGAAPVISSQLAQPPQQQQPSSGSNVHSVSEQDMVNAFPPVTVTAAESAAQSDSAQSQLNQQSSGDGLGGGLNADMIDALLRSDDPKWRQSKFLQFISKIKSGQIEFRDNQAIDRGGAAPSDTEQQQQQQQQAASGQQWADEYSSGGGAEQEQQAHSSFPSAWSEDFEQREGMRGLSTADDLSRMAAGWSSELSGDAEDEKVWEAEYRRVVQGEDGQQLDEEGGANDVEDEKEWARQFQSHADFDSFSHINWREALEKARTGSSGSGATVEEESAAAAADPQYHFTSPLQSSHSDANAAFEEGVRLLERGELRAAISAFETAVRLDPEHSEAWCQLGAAQAENEEESNAIAALLRAVAIDPYNLKALMMLGVSYTNDLEESRALQYLKTWSHTQQLPATKQLRVALVTPRLISA